MLLQAHGSNWHEAADPECPMKPAGKIRWSNSITGPWRGDGTASTLPRYKETRIVRPGLYVFAPHKKSGRGC
jgi:hypothetical protein